MAGETGTFLRDARGRSGVGAGTATLFLSAAFVGLMHVERVGALPAGPEDGGAGGSPTGPLSGARTTTSPAAAQGAGDAAPADGGPSFAVASAAGAGTSLLPFAGGAVAPEVLLALGRAPAFGPDGSAPTPPGPTDAPSSAPPADSLPSPIAVAAALAAGGGTTLVLDASGPKDATDPAANGPGAPVGRVIAGGEGDDVLTGTDEADVLAGGAGNDILDGAGGDDRLMGGAGDDVLLGGAGNDLLFGDEGDDTLSGGAGHDRLEGGPGADRLDGGTGDDLLFGDDGSDVLDGGPGTDVMYGGLGDDAIVIRDVLDVVVETGTESGGRDRVVIAPGFSDRVAALFGGQAPDGGVTFLLAEEVTGSLPQDVHTFTRRLPGIEELVIDDPAPHHAVGGAAAERIVGSDAANVLYGMGGNDVLEGRGGDDRLYGGAGDDRLYGGPGDDVLWGGEGDDLLDGGPGKDRLYGGPGNDVYLLGVEDGPDWIEDPEGREVLRVVGAATGELSLAPEGEDLVLRRGDTLIARVLRAAGDPSRFTVEGDLPPLADASRQDADGSDVAADPRADPGALADDHALAGDLPPSVGAGPATGDAQQSGDPGDILVVGPFAGDATEPGAAVPDGGASTAGMVAAGAGDGGMANQLAADGGHAGTAAEVAGDPVAGHAEGTGAAGTAGESGGGVLSDLLAPFADLPRVAGGAGDDILWGPQDGPGHVSGGEGRDVLRGGPFADLLEGGPGDDDLYGGAGDDLLAGGPGNDRLDGGPGDDVYLLHAGEPGTDLLDDADGTSRVVMPDVRAELISGFLVGDDLWVMAGGDHVLIVRGFAEDPAAFAGIQTKDGFLPASQLVGTHA